MSYWVSLPLGMIVLAPFAAAGSKTSKSARQAGVSWSMKPSKLQGRAVVIEWRVRWVLGSQVAVAVLGHKKRREGLFQGS